MPAEVPRWVPSRIARDLVVDERGCWLWQGDRSSKGYGLVTIRLRRWRVHRYVWRASGRPLGDDVELDHVCRVTACANVAHLEPVSKAQNLERAWRDRAIEAAWADGGTW